MLNFELLPEPIEHHVEQGSDEWKILRIGKITGSKYKRIMPAKNARDKKAWTEKQLDYLYGVAEEILTEESIGSDYMSESMADGHLYEPKAREYMSDYLLTNIRECGFFEVSSMVGDSPDGLIGPNGKEWGTLEIKSAAVRVHLKRQNNKEWFWDQHKWQSLGHMLATRRDTGFLMSYCDFMPEGKKALIVEPPKGYKDTGRKIV